jgi:hypothetical protein
MKSLQEMLEQKILNTDAKTVLPIVEEWLNKNRFTCERTKPVYFLIRMQTVDDLLGKVEK